MGFCILRGQDETILLESTSFSILVMDGHTDKPTEFYL